MTDDTITATRDFTAPDDYTTEHDTPAIDPKRITKEAKRIERRHPLSPPEPAPEPTAPPEGGEGEQPAAGESDDKTVDYREDSSAAAGA